MNFIFFIMGVYVTSVGFIIFDVTKECESKNSPVKLHFKINPIDLQNGGTGIIHTAGEAPVWIILKGTGGYGEMENGIPDKD